jgi:2-dehydro-3-deoxyphosphogluconate aldolase / (4S)-4-hydroxy-2-oxoglutarate aldolase
MRAEEVMMLSPVMPVVTIEDAAQAAPLARALLAGGVRTIEVTLRTPAALDAIRAISRQAIELVVGAGTVLSEKDLNAALEAGASYALSPGATPELLRAAQRAPIPFIPGVASASELMLAIEYGFRAVKFFPAERLGGVAALKDLGGPFPAARFCPTGGIGVERVRDYLTLPNVLCVGGSWVATSTQIAAGDWAAIEAQARQAASMR